MKIKMLCLFVAGLLTVNAYCCDGDKGCPAASSEQKAVSAEAILVETLEKKTEETVVDKIEVKVSPTAVEETEVVEQEEPAISFEELSKLAANLSKKLLEEANAEDVTKA